MKRLFCLLLLFMVVFNLKANNGDVTTYYLNELNSSKYPIPHKIYDRPTSDDLEKINTKLNTIFTLLKSIVPNGINFQEFVLAGKSHLEDTEFILVKDGKLLTMDISGDSFHVTLYKFNSVNNDYSNAVWYDKVLEVIGDLKEKAAISRIMTIDPTLKLCETIFWQDTPPMVNERFFYSTEELNDTILVGVHASTSEIILNFNLPSEQFSDTEYFTKKETDDQFKMLMFAILDISDIK